MRDRINQLITNLSQYQKALTPDKRLIEDLGFDSLKVMEFITTLEDELEVSISLKRLMGVKTLGDIYRLVDEHVPGSRAAA
jgi:acyl carrier protein